MKEGAHRVHYTIKGGVFLSPKGREENTLTKIYQMVILLPKIVFLWPEILQVFLWALK